MTQEKKEFLDPTVDCMFKGVMLDPNNPDYLKGFIHFISGMPYDDLENLEIKNSEYVVNNKNDKKMRSDIIVSVSNKIINIEMDRTYYDGIFIKNGAYHHKIAASLFDESEKYTDSKITMQIMFQNFSHFKNKKEVHRFVFKEETTNERLYKKGEEIVSKYVIDLAYIKEVCYNKDVSELSDFEKYCLLLVTTDKDKSREISEGDLVMEKVNKRLEELSSDDKLIGVYNAEIEEEKIKRTIEAGAEKRGFNNGLKQGIENGIKQEKINIAKSMLKKTDDLHFISEVTGLSIEQIESLK